MSETEGSGPHRVPVPLDDAPVRMPRWALYALIAALAGAGGGTGLGAIIHGGASGDVGAALTKIESKLDVIDEKLDTSKRTLDDHECRLRKLEGNPCPPR